MIHGASLHSVRILILDTDQPHVTVDEYKDFEEIVGRLGILGIRTGVGIIVLLFRHILSKI